MTLDSKEQQKIILRLVDVATFTGKSLDETYHFKQAVLNAEIQTPEPDVQEKNKNK